MAQYSKEKLFDSSKNHLLGLYALQQTQGKEEVQQFIDQLLSTDHGETETTKALIAFYYNNPELRWNKTFMMKLSAFLKSI